MIRARIPSPPTKKHLPVMEVQKQNIRTTRKTKKAKNVERPVLEMSIKGITFNVSARGRVGR
jgi:hypothetical protein